MLTTITYLLVGIVLNALCANLFLLLTNPTLSLLPGNRLIERLRGLRLYWLIPPFGMVLMTVIVLSGAITGFRQWFRDYYNY